MEFHFIITLTEQDGACLRTVTVGGTVIADPGQTRQDLFLFVLAHAKQETGVRVPAVTFFDVAPNTLPAAAGQPAIADCGEPR